MAVYLVTFELGREIHHAGLTAEIKKTSWTQLTATTYAVDTTELAEELFSRLRLHTDNRDSLYVIALKMPYGGTGDRDVGYWLEEHLRW
ncbi:hypothetical protein [Ancylobacter terrae]|uniref:hypothetical protein n=1 Tax=Ancylobacter sp. sgz301288 TaxID=3342077 RepID=UPI00385FB81C